MKRIEIHNDINMCSEESCSNEPKYSDLIEYEGLKVFIKLCEKHYLIATGMSNQEAEQVMKKKGIVDDVVNSERIPVTKHRHHSDEVI